MRQLDSAGGLGFALPWDDLLGASMESMAWGSDSRGQQPIYLAEQFPEPLAERHDLLEPLVDSVQMP